jgi:drug/metabolite transporter (DMT)-like permease
LQFLDKSSDKLFTYVILGIGVITFGFAPILVQYAGGVSAIVLVSYRTVFAAIFLLPYWLKHRASHQISISRGERVQVALAGICLGLNFTCWIASLSYTSVAVSSVLVTIHPIILILFERFWYKRGFARTTWAGVILAFIGSALLGIFGANFQQLYSHATLGNVLAILAAFFFAAYLLLGQHIRQRRQWINYVFPVYSYAAILCLILLISFRKDPVSISAIALLAGLGLAVGPSLLGHGSMNYAVKYLSPTLLGTLILVEPLIASVLAYFLFDEIPSLFSIAAMAVVVVGIGLTWKRSRRNA